MKLMISAAATALIALSASAAIASTPTTATLDSFSVFQGPLSNPLGESNTTAIGGGIDRTLTLSPIAGLPPIQYSLVSTGGPGGFLDITNGNGDDSMVTVQWSIPAFNLPIGSTDVSFFVDVLTSDSNPAEVALDLNGINLGGGSIGPNANNQRIFFSTDPTLLTGGNLRMVFNGAIGWDLGVDAVGIRFTPPAQVSEPTTLALLGAGLLGAGLLGRRRKA
jgi:hypothetical protein